ncbi:hypothetical protein PIB30_045492 [Stylosanthes scabra]|uniref:Uncharacterized protein n=1 Tax=Stylosanthes scabra TaxID=79078 RepID=A0ABU6YDK0_9FABA|nr:hypothetical protein [Stylosanthes scabra]
MTTSTATAMLSDMGSIAVYLSSDGADDGDHEGILKLKEFMPTSRAAIVNECRWPLPHYKPLTSTSVYNGYPLAATIIL